MAKRIVERPWGTRRKGGWVISTKSLIESLKKGASVQLDKVTVGTKPLIELLRLFPGEYCWISANGRIEVETIRMVFRNVNGKRKPSFVRPKRYYNWFGLDHGAWLKPHMRLNPVILKPKKF